MKLPIALFLLFGIITDNYCVTASWWEHAVFYQIYPRSFKDSNNDGIGDLKGIISKINYFPETGINAIWLSPIFKSPQVDMGYDISDYKTVDKDYGSNEDLKELIEKAHKEGIKVILDFVPNHTSDQAQWFKDSIAKKEPFTDFYVWADGKKDANGILQPPNNWMSLFGGSAWTYNQDRNQFYLHQFAPQQPDLNYRNPEVIKFMNDILLFWLDQNVDGFRVDAVPFLIEDKDLTDEPTINGTKGTNWFELNHIYTKDLPETYDIVYQWRLLVDNYTKSKGGEDRILMTEAYSGLEETILYYGDKNSAKLGAHFTFNFYLITNVTKKSSINDISNVINKWLQSLPKDYVSNWVLGNHDNARMATRFGPHNVDGFNMLTATLPGIMITYNGEEIGQENGEVSFNEGKDPGAKDPKTFDKNSRDFERTPFQWDATVNAGFNDGAKPWLPVSKKYMENNLAHQKNAKNSHYKIYQELIKLRKEPPLRDGDVTVKSIGNKALLVKRCYKKDCIALLFNNKEQEVVIDVKDWIPEVNHVILTSEKSDREKGFGVVPSNLKMQKNEAIIIRY